MKQKIALLFIFTPYTFDSLYNKNCASSNQFLMLWIKNDHVTSCFEFQEFVEMLAYIT